jgi:hypothetical protein
MQYMQWLRCLSTSLLCQDTFIALLTGFDLTGSQRSGLNSSAAGQ